MKYILGVAAGKGGVGKSSLTVNLALCFQKMGLKVGIMDADLYGPSLQKMLPEDTLPRPSVEHPGKLTPAQKNGMSLISMAYFLKDEEAAAIVRAPIANQMIKQFFHGVHWGELDCLLIDFPPGTGDIQLTLMQEGSLSGGIVVTTPQEVALQDVRKAISLFRHMRVPVFGLVENMSYFQDPVSDRRYYPLGRGGGKRLCLREAIPFLGEIPLDEQISHCCDAGISLLEKGGISAEAYFSIAKEVWDQLLAYEQLEGECIKDFKLQWNP